MKTPFPYQIIGAQHLSSRRRALLFDDMGLGKTLQAIMACAEVSPSPHVTVVAPASVVPVWEDAFTREWPRFDNPRILVLSYERLTRNPELTEGTQILIADEAHYCKTTNAKRSKAVKAVADKAEYAWGLTGTPVMNHLGELYNLLRIFAPPSVAEFRGELQFWERYTFVRETDWGPKPTGRRNVDELRKRMYPYVLRRRKDEVLADLPPIRWGEIGVRAPAMEGVTEDQQVGMRKAMAALELGHQPPVDESQVTTRRLIEVAKAKPLADFLRDELTDGDHKIVVFGWFNEALDIVEEELSKFGVMRLSGGAAPAHRAKAVKEFQENGKVRVFVGQILAAGTGLTLTAAYNVVFIGLDWVPTNNAQAAMRVHRIGQEEPVLIRTANLIGSIDDVVQEVLSRKTRDILALWEQDDDAA